MYTVMKKNFNRLLSIDKLKNYMVNRKLIKHFSRRENISEVKEMSRTIFVEAGLASNRSVSWFAK